MSENNQKKWLGWLVLLIIIIAIIVFCWLLFKGKETYITTEYNTDKTTAIECRSNVNIENAFFDDFNARSFEHVIKATFRNDSIDKITYNYEADFNSDDKAETAKAVMHASYSKYMANKNLRSDILKPTFSNSGSHVKITLITDVDKLIIDDALFFFLSADEFQRIRSYNEENLTKKYNGKGFSCETYK